MNSSAGFVNQAGIFQPAYYYGPQPDINQNPFAQAGPSPRPAEMALNPQFIAKQFETASLSGAVQDMDRLENEIAQLESQRWLPEEGDDTDNPSSFSRSRPMATNREYGYLHGYTTAAVLGLDVDFLDA